MPSNVASSSCLVSQWHRTSLATKCRCSVTSGKTFEKTCPKREEESRRHLIRPLFPRVRQHHIAGTEHRFELAQQPQLLALHRVPITTGAFGSDRSPSGSHHWHRGSRS